MDETQKTKGNAKDYIKDHKRFIGLSLVVFILFFLVLILIFLTYVYFPRSVNGNINIVDTSTSTSAGSLLPIFKETDLLNKESSTSLLTDFSIRKLGTILGAEDSLKSADDASKVYLIEDNPVSGFTTVEKKISIKNYIKDKPKVCGEKLTVYLQKDTKGKEVTNFQVLFRTISGFEDTPQTDILDEETRNRLYIFQKKYTEILYKNKTDKEPTKLIDKETVHFLNMLCDLEVENNDDFYTYSAVRYVVKETGKIFDYDTESKKIIPLSTPPTATSTEEVLFSKNADYIVLRKQLKGDIQTYLMNLKLNRTDRLEDNILTVDVGAEKMVYGVQNGNYLQIKELTFKDEKIKNVTNVPLVDWNLKYLDDSTLILALKGTVYGESIAITLDIKSGFQKQLIKPTVGLAIQPTDISDLLIYSDGGKGSLQTYLVNTKTKTFGPITIPTLAEKCAQGIFLNGIFCAVPKDLNQNYLFPDDYYKNKINTEDILVYRKLTSTSTKIVSYFENKPFDVIDLNIKNSGIFFRDKKTLKLYKLGF